jgi:hypothetical protein
MPKILRILILSFTVLATNVNAQDLKPQDSKANIYNIESISSKASGKSPANSKTIASINARRDAFMVLLMRLQIPISKADEISNDEISEMVRSEQIFDEKIIGNTYLANFNITFAKDFVDHILKSKEKEDTANKDLANEENYIIIPIKMSNKRPLIWEEENDWMPTLKRIVNKNNLHKKFILPEANIENVSMINGQNIKNLGYENFSQLIQENNAHSTYLLFYNFDEIANKVIVEVSYFRKLQKKQFRLSFVNVDRLSSNDLLVKVAERTIDYLKNNPIGNDNALNKNLIDLTIKISSLDDWLNIKTIFDKANFIEGYEINSISRDEVSVSINYLNTQVPIDNEFKKLGFIFSKRTDNSYDINAIGR